jgi:bacteriorhodopsin
LIRPFEILDSAGDVTFPDDYPNSVKHVLLIGTVGFFISAVVFLYLSMTRKKASVAHSLTFLSTAVAAMAYYCMWNGLGVEYKTSDITPRVIFWARHFDQILTLPIVLGNLCIIARSDSAVTVGLVGEGILFTLAAAVGAATVAPIKYMWWFASATFGVLIIITLLQRIPEGSLEVHKNLTFLTVAAVAIYGVLWLLGSEGTAALGLSQEVGIFTFVDLASKAGFGLYFLLNYEALLSEDEDMNQESQQYV